MSISKKRVLVIDDSVFARKIVGDILRSSPELEVLGAAANGLEGLSLVQSLHPDVVTLDIEMPGIDGLETLKRIMQECPTPVVMISSLTTRGAEESIAALGLGAVDVMAKPHGTHSIGLTAQAAELIGKVITAASVDVSRFVPVAGNNAKVAAKPAVLRASAFPVVVIASSTGGPRALRALVPHLSRGPGTAYVLVQHLPEGFSGPLAKDLDNATDLNVREASDGDSLRSGDMLVAKAGFHLVFHDACTVRLTKSPPLWGVRPSADATMASAASIFRSRMVGSVLTGMGRDGTDGLKLIKEAGGITLAEHESTCVVYGMPRAAIESGVVDVVAPLDKMADAISQAALRVAGSRAEPKGR